MINNTIKNLGFSYNNFFSTQSRSNKATDSKYNKDLRNSENKNVTTLKTNVGSKK